MPAKASSGNIVVVKSLKNWLQFKRLDGQRNIMYYSLELNIVNILNKL